MRLLACPGCGSTEDLATVEHLEGLAGACFGREDSGELDIEWDGYTRIAWDTSTTIGVWCRCCDWNYEGGDWAEKLIAL